MYSCTELIFICVKVVMWECHLDHCEYKVKQKNTSHESYMREYPYSVFVMTESIISIKGVYIAFSFKGASNELSEDPISISL